MSDFGLAQVKDEGEMYFADPQMDDFWECKACAVKAGTPTLCSSCLHNRALVRRLWTEIGGLKRRRMPEWLFGWWSRRRGA